jgi:hypothetical protein
MKIMTGKNRVLFIGFALGFTIAMKFFYVTQSSYTSYHYPDKEFRTKVMEQLDKKGFLYSYEIDHIKRHWVTPHVYDEKFYEDFLVEFCIEFTELCY